MMDDNEFMTALGCQVTVIPWDVGQGQPAGTMLWLRMPPPDDRHCAVFFSPENVIRLQRALQANKNAQPNNPEK